MTEMVTQTSRYARRLSLHRLTAMSEQQYGRRAVETGPTGKTVAENLIRLRKVRGLSTRQLATALEERGRSLSPSGVTRMEKAERHVTADELVALAAIFRVNPSALLLPLKDGPEESIEITGVGSVAAGDAWDWVDGERPLATKTGDLDALLDFDLYARPPRHRRTWGQIKDALGGIKADVVDLLRGQDGDDG
ncbi:helix-turn-helix transcriptional regulator [Streptomyces sp. NPDC002685]|uniref:helix-turn-helix domain-containing protein n=1 Tax=Streptomyces sp. NPDC002685 TaxID=3154540 RepID=UPI00332F424A